MLTLEALGEIKLEKGAHASPEQGMCFMEAVAYFAGQPHSDHPACVSPVLGSFLRNWNDSVNDVFRQELKPFIPRVIGTAEDGKDERRAWMATDWLVRVCAPAWLDLCQLTQHAMALRTAEEIRHRASAKRVQPRIDAARDAAYAAGAAAGAAAYAAGAAAGDAVGAAAGDAARAAAWAAAGAAARTAARTAAWDAAGAAAWAAARTAAGAAAWDAAGAAAWAALKPTVELLQASALELLDRMASA